MLPYFFLLVHQYFKFSFSIRYSNLINFFWSGRMCLGLYLHHPSMHVTISPFTSLPFLFLKTFFLILYLTFFLLKLSQKQQPLSPALNPRSLPAFPFLSLVFRPYTLSYSHLYTLIYFFLLNLRKKYFSPLKKFFSINKNELFWTESVVCILVYPQFFIILSDLPKRSTFSSHS